MSAACAARHRSSRCLSACCTTKRRARSCRRTRMTEHLDADVTIIGGGIVGASAALFLRRFGLSVVLLERGLCGAAASGVNYGGVRTQGRAMAQLPLSMRARALWAQLPALIGIDGEYVQS